MATKDSSDSEIEETIDTYEDDDMGITEISFTTAPIASRTLISMDGKKLSGSSRKTEPEKIQANESVQNSGDQVLYARTDACNSQNSSYSSCSDSIEKGSEDVSTANLRKVRSQFNLKMIQCLDGNFSTKPLYDLRLFASYFIATYLNNVIKVKLQPMEPMGPNVRKSTLELIGACKVCRIGKTLRVAVLRHANRSCTISVIDTECFRILYDVRTKESVYNGIAYLTSLKAECTTPNPKYVFAVWYSKTVGGNTFTDHVDKLEVMANQLYLSQGHSTFDCIVELLDFEPAISRGIHCAEAFGNKSILISSGNILMCYEMSQKDSAKQAWGKKWEHLFERSVSCICVSGNRAYIVLKDKRQMLVLDKDGKRIDSTGLPEKLNVDPELVDVCGDMIIVIGSDADSRRTVLSNDELPK